MQVTEHIHAIRIPFTITVSPTVTLDRFVYAYLICGEKITLIDTGVAGSRETIFEYIKSIGRDPEEISNVILTHSHPDHIGAVKSIKDSLGCRVMIHATERPWVENVNRQFEERPVPGFHTLVEGSVAIDHTFQDGEVITLDEDLALNVFHTPGHSKGSTSFLLKKDNALFCGDTILMPGQMPIFEDLESCINSTQKLRAIDNVEVLLASWDSPQEGSRVSKLMDESVRWLLQIRETAKSIAENHPSLNPTDFCKAALSALGLPETILNPLVIKSFQSAL